jgi:two-component system sensor kinase FixL
VIDERDSLIKENAELRSQLNEALEALEAIRSGEVDAVVIYGESGEQVYTLQGADQTYRVMMESIAEGAATLSEDGIVTWANAYLADMLNMPLELLLGSEVSCSIAPADRKAFDALLNKSRQEKCKIELDFQGRNDETLPVLLSLNPIPASDSTVICLVATDLAEQKRNIEIAAAERTAKTIIEQAAEAIVVCDIQGIVVRVSQSALRLLAQNPLLKPFEEAFPLITESLPPTNSPFSVQAVLSGAEFQGIEATLEPPHATGFFHLYVSAKPLDVPGTGNLGCVVTMTDVTAHKQAEQALLKYAHQLKRSNEDLESFAFIASHDLQEPLRKIQSFSKILLNPNNKPQEMDRVDYLRRIQNAVSRMEKMIDDLLTYSRLSNLSQSFEQIDLNLIVKNVLTDLDGLIVTSGGKVEVGELPLIEADPQQMNHLFQNIVGNALKFHKNDESPAVRVYTRNNQPGNKTNKLSSPLSVEIVIEDNGIGFDMKYLERIFQPFQRLQGRSEFEGSGIGLSICRKIVERHNGQITAISAPGEGSTFIVTLPVEQRS